MPKTYWIFGLPNQTARFGLPKNDDFDQYIRSRFFPLWQQAAAGELADWRDTLRGRLAEIIILDQFSRNLFRGSPAAFAQDLATVCLAQEALRLPGFAAMKEEERHFILSAADAQRKPRPSTPKPPRCSNATLPNQRRISNCGTKPSSTASAVIRTAMPFWAGKARLRNKTFSAGRVRRFKHNRLPAGSGISRRMADTF